MEIRSETQAKMEAHVAVIKKLLAPSGLFLASAQGVSTGYDKAWLRDNFYTSLALEAVGDMETMMRVWKALVRIFKVHQEKISWAVANRPHATYQYIHARYHPETFEEFWEEWGNKQNDAVGCILYKIGELEAKGVPILEGAEDRQVLQRLVDYLATIEYWHDPDNGVWEEYEEVHASSVGACVAGLKSISRLEGVNVPQELVLKGEEALHALLPRESVTKFTDLALLSLIFPYETVDPVMEEELLKNLEYHLEKKRGVIRYKNDRYYNKNADGWSEEAEWTMGFPWLSIIYARKGEREKALEYLKKSEDALYDGMLPELYYSNSERPNENIPLGWAESLYVVALRECEKFAQTI